MPEPEGLSAGALIAFRTLRDHPEIKTPLEIASGPYEVDQVTSYDVELGLGELEERKLAVQTFGGWSLVEQ